MGAGEAAPTESQFQWNALLYRHHSEPHEESRPGTVPLPPGVGAIQGKDTGRRYLYRPGEVLVHEEDLETYPDLRQALVDQGAQQMSESNDAAQHGPTAAPPPDPGDVQAVIRAKVADRQLLAKTALDELRIARFKVDRLGLLDAAAELPRFIDDLRRQGWPVHPHIVLAGESGSYGPAEPPRRVDDIPVIAAPGHLGTGIRVGVIDTGIWKSHQLLAKHCESRGVVDDEVLDENGDTVLDFEAGHGTFIAGIIRQYAPAATIVCRGTLDAMGVIDDSTLAGTVLSLREERLDILNLSLGGYTLGSDPTGLPATMGALALLRKKNPRLLVVAAAGNHNRAEPFWPAASPDVVGVGALDGNFSKALFSNYGSWVNAWAPGVRLLSSFVGTNLGRPGGGSRKASARWSGTSFATPVIAGKLAAAMKRPSSADA